MGGGGIENIKNRGDERTQPALLLLSTSYPHISIYLYILYILLHISIFILFFFLPFEEEEKKRKIPPETVTFGRYMCRRDSILFQIVVVVEYFLFSLIFAAFWTNNPVYFFGKFIYIIMLEDI